MGKFASTLSRDMVIFRASKRLSDFIGKIDIRTEMNGNRAAYRPLKMRIASILYTARFAFISDFSLIRSMLHVLAVVPGAWCPCASLLSALMYTNMFGSVWG